MKWMPFWWFGRGLGAVPGGESAKRHTMLVREPYLATLFPSLLPPHDHQNDIHFTNISQLFHLESPTIHIILGESHLKTT